MPTIRQLINKPRLKKKTIVRKYKLLSLQGAPMLKGVCVKVKTMKPKKPNSAIRKIARVKLTNNRVITAYIPGQGHNLQEHSVVFVRGGRTKDLPGLHYKLIRGSGDFDWKETITRCNARSKYGVPLEENKTKDDEIVKEI